MSDQWSEKLSQFLDGELAEKERVDLEAHLVECSSCRLDLEGLRQVVDTARQLPAVPPEQDLWPAIAARIAPEQPATGRVVESTRPGFWGLRFTFSLPQLVAAGAAAVMLVAMVSWWSVRTNQAGKDQIAMEDGATSETVLAASSRAYMEFADEVTALRTLLDENGDKLDDETVRVIEKNLKIIEEAIAQSRQALEADPANSYVQEHLVATMGGKLKLLRNATDVALAEWEKEI